MSNYYLKLSPTPPHPAPDSDRVPAPKASRNRYFYKSWRLTKWNVSPPYAEGKRICYGFISKVLRFRVSSGTSVRASIKPWMVA